MSPQALLLCSFNSYEDYSRKIMTRINFMCIRPVVDHGVLDLANKFHITARNLYIDSSDTMLVPSVVNATFALELYLKSINMKWKAKDLAEEGSFAGIAWLVNRKPVKTGHSPSVLFDDLRLPIKHHLEQRYSTHGLATSESLRDTLSRFDKVFQGWRYIFESNSNLQDINLPKLFSSLEFLRDEIPDIPMEFGGY